MLARPVRADLRTLLSMSIPPLRAAAAREIPIEMYIWPDRRAVRAHCWLATAIDTRTQWLRRAPVGAATCLFDCRLDSDFR
jgi:hypothetical protein